MADPTALAQWGQMSYNERLFVLGQAFPGGIPPDALERLLVDEIKRQFGYLSTYLDHPEIGPMLRNAASHGWTQERLQAELHKTQWWQQTSAAKREFELLTRTDPAEAQRRVGEVATTLRILADQQGFGDRFDDATITGLAGEFLSQGMSQEQMQKALFAHVNYVPGSTPIGQAGLTMSQVKSRAQEFGLPMSDQAAFDWAKRVATGETSAEAVDVYLRDQAKGRYSWLADDLDRGATIRQIFDPMIQQTAQLLEISPSRIDLTDPKFSRLIDHVDESGNRRSMTLAEAAVAVRETDEWQRTENGRRSAAELAESVVRTFGKVAA